MTFTPRDYQTQMHDETMHEISNNRNTANVLATRGGKSYGICKLAEIGYLTGKPVMIVVHTDILLTQIAEDLKINGIPHGIIKAGHYETNEIVQVASRATVVKRLHKYPEDYFKTIIFDETHLIKGATSMKIFHYFKTASVVGFTATLSRLDNSPFSDVYQSIVRGPDKLELIKREIIVPSIIALPEVTMLDNLKIVAGDYSKASVEKALKGKYIHGEYVQHYMDFAPHKKGLIFCSTVDFSREVSANFNAAGISCVDISARDGKNGVAKKLSDYYSGKYTLMASIDLFIMGLNVKEAEVSISLRPTASSMIYYQMNGRGTMTSPETGKTEHIIIDCVNNIMTHGHPDIELIPSLQGETKSDRQARLNQIALSIVRCDKCRWSYNKDTAPRTTDGNIICPRCSAELEIHGRSIKTIDGKLTLVNSQQWQDYELQKRWEAEQEYLQEERDKQKRDALQAEVRSASSREALEKIAKDRGYAQGWVEHKMRGKGLARNRHRVNSMF